MTTQVTFGRDGAMFEQLLDFVAQLSIGVWGLVIITLVMRFIGVQAYRRVSVRPVSASTALEPTGRRVPTVPIDHSRTVEGQQPDSGLVRLGLIGPGTALGDALTAAHESGTRPADTRVRASHSMSTGRGAAIRVPELAANSTEA